jgi:GNAT superfamily N-acetyltransferase
VHEAGYFARCLQEQAQGARVFYLAVAADGAIAGYAQLIWSPAYAPFRRLGIPEIQDINVLPACRRQGIGALLVDHAETLARAAGRTDIGISVGLSSSFGAAQRLYVRKGYMPDGCGIFCDNEAVQPGALYAVDEFLTLKLTKTL